MATGDLTIESFNTWHDADHRLNWGIHYFDEAGALPYTSDLVRLATSVHVALRDTGRKHKLDRMCKHILSGYEESLNVGGRPFVLEEQTARFRDAMLSNLKNPKTFWARVANLPWTKNVPHQVKEVFAAMMPGISFRMTLRVAGVSSLGRRRFAALGDWKGGKVGWEAKALAPPAMAWVTGQNTPAAEGRNAIVRNSVGNPDPSASVRGHWLISRLSPEFGSRPFYLLSKRDKAESLYAMGWETANIHLSSTQAVKSVKAHLAQRPKNWLKRAVRLMTEATEKDWLEWKKSLRFL
jgi:hypothetical protein